jgi:hypothetical protein
MEMIVIGWKIKKDLEERSYNKARLKQNLDVNLGGK